MSKISGINVKLFIMDTTGKVLAGQRSASLSRSADTMDATSKDSAGGWKENLAGFKEWSIDADGCYVTSDAAYGVLETAYIAGTAVSAYLEFPSGAKYQGNALITDFGLEAPYDDLVTYSISLQGSGELAYTAGV